MAIKSTTLDSTATTVYQSRGNTIVTSLYFCNRNDLVSVTFDLYLVPNLSGSTNIDDHIVYKSVQIAPLDTYVIDTEKLMLDDADMIQATASGAGFIVATISYMEY